VTAERRQPTREADDQAIEALCFLLDRLPPPDSPDGGGIGLGSRSGLEATRGALWSEILRRRLQNKYEGTPPVGRTQWIQRHFHLRRLIDDKEGDEASAKHVARIWNANATTVLDGATRKVQKTAAFEWLQVAMAGWKDFPGGPPKPAPTTAAIYEALELGITRIAADFSNHEKGKTDTANAP